MARSRPPLPPVGVTREYATDWATGDITDDVVFRDGKWWTRYHYETVRRDRERDRERGRRNRAVSRFLNAQSTSAGL